MKEYITYQEFEQVARYCYDGERVARDWARRNGPKEFSVHLWKAKGRVPMTEARRKQMIADLQRRQHEIVTLLLELFNTVSYPPTDIQPRQEPRMARSVADPLLGGPEDRVKIYGPERK